MASIADLDLIPDMGRIRFDVAIAAAAFAGLCIAVLARSTSLLEPDDLAYHASIVALSQGHVTLSSAEFGALAHKLGVIAQWVHLPNGRWISEKNPGYPFLAVPFQWLDVLRLAPLFYGGLACVGLFAGARRWLGRFGGAWAVVLYCSSGAALVFAWRATMPTFTDASLVAAGAGALLWTFLATDASQRRRAVVGLLGFLALEAATFTRYTDVVALGVACMVAPLVARRCGLGRRALLLWAASVAAFGALVASFDAVVYGGVLRTGYRSGEIQFALNAIGPNLREMPQQLLWSMPLILLALVALVWIGLRLRSGAPGARHDAAVAAALASVWLGIYALYAAYTWTAQQGAGGPTGLVVSVHLIRFYVPALGAVALLAAWLVYRLPRWLPLVALVGVVTLGGVTYPRLADNGGMPGIGRHGPVPGGGPPPGGPPPIFYYP
jgi:hypothetical protein